MRIPEWCQEYSSIQADSAPVKNSFSFAAQAEAMTDSIYRFFMQRVAEGRGLSAEATRAVAKGRVWSGGSLLCRWWTLWTSCSVQFRRATHASSKQRGSVDQRVLRPLSTQALMRWRTGWSTSWAGCRTPSCSRGRRPSSRKRCASNCSLHCCILAALKCLTTHMQRKALGKPSAYLVHREPGFC